MQWLVKLYQKNKSAVIGALSVAIACSCGLGFWIYSSRGHRKASEHQVEGDGDIKTNNNNLSVASKIDYIISKKIRITHQKAVELARELSTEEMKASGSPGLVVAVSMDGIALWSEGMGWSDLENQTLCTTETVMRIASISKPISMALALKLWDEGKLDIDASVRKYVKDWPEKKVDGKDACVTVRQIASHLSGIRNYDKSCTKHKLHQLKKKDDSTEKSTSDVTDVFLEEYYMKKVFPDITTALSIFKDDELCSLPGTEYLYSTHSFTVLSAVLESVTRESFKKLMADFFQSLGMESTYLDDNSALIFNRAKFYEKRSGILHNAPYVDCSSKWAGGGFLSTAGDLLKFANVLLYSCQSNDASGSLLKPETITMMWTPVPNTHYQWKPEGDYGMCWSVVSESQMQPFHVSHIGLAIGASSTLLIVPHQSEDDAPRGVAVAILSNVQGVQWYNTALRIAKLFHATR